MENISCRIPNKICSLKKKKKVSVTTLLHYRLQILTSFQRGEYGKKGTEELHSGEASQTLLQQGNSHQHPVIHRAANAHP